MKFTKKNISFLKGCIKFFKYTFILLIIIFILGFLLAIPRILSLGKYYSEVRNQDVVLKISSLVALPDSLCKSTSVPDFSGINWRSFSSTVDSEGVALLNYDKLGIRGVNGKQRCPWYITVFGLQQLSEYIKKRNPSNLLLALRQIDYLTNEFKLDSIDGTEVGFWPIHFALKYQYNTKVPWYCAFNQAYCLIAMLNAYQITRDQKYLKIIEKGIRAYKFEVKRGGLSYKTKNGGLFFEEVASAKPHHILNGHMIALLIVHECMLFTGSSEAKMIFDLGVKGLKDMLPNYDYYNYSLYSLSPNPSIKNHFNIASPFYHNLHIAQLKALTKISRDKIFSKYFRKWKNETGGIYEFTLTSFFVLFKDAMKVIKAVNAEIEVFS